MRLCLFMKMLFLAFPYISGLGRNVLFFSSESEARETEDANKRARSSVQLLKGREKGGEEKGGGEGGGGGGGGGKKRNPVVVTIYSKLSAQFRGRHFWDKIKGILSFPQICFK